MGVTSSILPIFMPERAKARRADCAPGPGVLVPFPTQKPHVSPFLSLFPEKGTGSLTSRSPNLNMQRINPQLLAPRRHILRRQHGRIRRGLVAVGFDFHAAGDTGDGFAATGITQVVSLHRCQKNIGFVWAHWVLDYDAW